MYSVQKRDGKVVDFSIGKISDAIRKAFQAQEKEFNQDVIDFLALKVTADFSNTVYKKTQTRYCGFSHICNNHFFTCTCNVAFNTKTCG